MISGFSLLPIRSRYTRFCRTFRQSCSFAKFLLNSVEKDAKNAFNLVSRSSFATLVAEHFPSLFPFVSSCSANPRSIWFGLGDHGSRIIHSEEGVQQGDPLGPMLFSLALHPCLSDTQSRLDTGFITSYLDDAVLLGPCSSVVSAFQSFEKQLSNIGLVIRRDKCEAYSSLRRQYGPSTFFFGCWHMFTW